MSTSEPKYPITLYPSLYDIDRLVSATPAWPELVASFQTHLEIERKDRAPGFGPYGLVPPVNPCRDHRGGARATPHRCDFCVRSLSLAVFDVDVGTVDAVSAADAALDADGVARLWYSTWSYAASAVHPSMRLVLPLARPVPAHAWPTVRRNLIRRYAIPADVVKCSGVSHFYYAPSCQPGAPHVFDSSDGVPVEPGDFPAHAPLIDPGAVDFDDPEDDGDEPVDLEPIVRAVRDRAGRMARSTDDVRRERAAVLYRVLAGEELAGHGSRNDVTSRTIQVIAHTVPSASVSAVKHLLRGSVDAMLAAGSSLTWSEVERMVVSALRRARRQAAVNDEIDANFGTSRERLVLERLMQPPPPPGTGRKKPTAL